MQRIRKTEEWKKLLESSNETPFLVLKVSATCSLSGFASRALGKLDQEFGTIMYDVLVQESRDVSDMIAGDLGVVHETPQVLIVKDREVVYSADHEEIETEDVQKALELVYGI